MINKVFIHPLFLLSVTDQIYRKNELSYENANPVQGLILGANGDNDNGDEDANQNQNQSENENATECKSVSLLISFELPYTSTSEQVDQKIELLKVIYGNLKVIGFYQISTSGENKLHAFSKLIHSWHLENAYLTKELVIVQVNPDIESTKSLESNIKIVRLKDFSEIDDKEVRTISSEYLGLQTYNKAVSNIENIENFESFDTNNNGESQHAKEQEEIQEGLTDLQFKLCELVEFCEQVIIGSVDVYGKLDIYESIKVVVKLVDRMKRVKSIATTRANDIPTNRNINNNNNENIIDKITALAICCLSFNEENVLGKSVQLRSNE